MTTNNSSVEVSVPVNVSAIKVAVSEVLAANEALEAAEHALMAAKQAFADACERAKGLTGDTKVRLPDGRTVLFSKAGKGEGTFTARGLRQSKVKARPVIDLDSDV